MGMSAAIVGSAVVGGVAANSAADKQANAAGKASDQQAQAAAQTRADLAPYAGVGQSAINPLWQAMGYTQKADPASIQKAQATLDNYIEGSKSHPEWDPGQIQQQIATYQQALVDAQNGTDQAQVLDPNSPLQQHFQNPNQFQMPGTFQAPGAFQAPDAYQAPAAFAGTGTFNPTGTTTTATPFSFDAKDLENTPGYQFSLQQGLKGVQNQMASQGLGLSGAQLKGAESFAQGLASTTYNQQLQNAMGINNQNFNQNLAANTQNYSQLANTNSQNYNQQANTYNLNATTGMAANNLIYNQALGTNNQNYNQALATNNQQFNQYAQGQNQQYNQALSQYNTNYQQAANNVSNLQYLTNLGQNSAAQSGQAGQTGANNAGNYLTQGANAQAAGIVGVGNAAQQGVNNYMLYNALYG